MRSIKNFVSEWAGFIVNLITLGGWIGGLVSAVLLSLLRSQGWKLSDGVTIGQVHLSFAMLIFLFVVCVVIVINAYLFGRLLKGAANSTADYKVICDKLPPALQDEIGKIDKANPYVNQAAANLCSELDEKGFKDLLNSDKVKCRNLNAESKIGKVILQCSFIPVDEKENTIIIQRRAENHESIFKKVHRWWKTIYSFISFSPIPDGYNQKFGEILSCYAHEVPVNEDVGLSENNFTFVGIIYNRRGGGKVNKPFLPWRKSNSVQANLGECIRYIFVVYLVDYPKLNFVDDNGKTNWTDINLAFSKTPEKKSRSKDRFFLKDHDYIVGAKPLSEIVTGLETVGGEESKYWLKVEQEAIRNVRRKLDELRQKRNEMKRNA